MMSSSTFSVVLIVAVMCFLAPVQSFSPKLFQKVQLSNTKTKFKSELFMAKKVSEGSTSKKIASSPITASTEVSEKPAFESKYIIAGVVFLLACLWDKQFMHGGIF